MDPALKESDHAFFSSCNGKSLDKVEGSNSNSALARKLTNIGGQHASGNADVFPVDCRTFIDPVIPGTAIRAGAVYKTKRYAGGTLH